MLIQGHTSTHRHTQITPTAEPLSCQHVCYANDQTSGYCLLPQRQIAMREILFSITFKGLRLGEKKHTEGGEIELQVIFRK